MNFLTLLVVTYFLYAFAEEEIFNQLNAAFQNITSLYLETKDSSCCFGRYKEPIDYDNFEKYCTATISEIQRNRMTWVSLPRSRASMLLALFALKVPGDFVETGVWMGGTTAMLMKVLMKYDECERKFWAFDSFEGFPAAVNEDKSGVARQGEKGQLKMVCHCHRNDSKRSLRLYI
jgi:hypothetical protein